MNGNEILALLKKTASDWMEDQAPTLGAALAYYTVFSLAPLLIIAIAIAGLVFGREAAQGQIFDQLKGLLGEASGKAMQEMVQNASAKPATGVVATLIGVVTLLLVLREFSDSYRPHSMQFGTCNQSLAEVFSALSRIGFSPSALSW
jgi:membrane protein